MYCGNCGQYLPDDAKFCDRCGAQVESAGPEQPAPAAGASKIPSILKANKKAVVKVAGGIAAVVIVIIVLSNIFGGGYKKPIKQLMRGIQTCNAEMVAKAKYAGTERYEEDVEDVDKDEWDDEDENLEDQMKLLEMQYGDDIKISYQIKDVEKLHGDDYDDAAETLENAYWYDQDDISAIYSVKARFTIKGDDDKDSETETFYCVKSNGKWSVAINDDF